jgi:hypothetical protein
MVLALKDALREIFRKTKLICLQEDASFDTVADTYFYYLDSRVLYPTSFIDEDNETRLKVYTRDKFNRDYPVPDTTDTGEPRIIVPIKKIWADAQPTAASTLSITSSSASDVTSYYVGVRGISGGKEKTERLTLTGATPVISSNSYTEVISITKDATVGTITATSNSAAVTVVTLLPNETEKQHWKVRLAEKVPDAAYTINYTFYQSPWNFSNDEDLIPFDDIFQDVLLDLTESIILDRQGDKKANDKWNKVMGQGGKLDNLLDSDYFSEDEDMRMGLIEVDSGEWE